MSDLEDDLLMAYLRQGKELLLLKERQALLGKELDLLKERQALLDEVWRAMGNLLTIIRMDNYMMLGLDKQLKALQVAIELAVAFDQDTPPNA